MVAFACYLTVPLLIPVLTQYPLPLGYMGDILGGGFILSLAGFAVGLAALDTGGAYAQLGSSRAMTFGALIEPSILFVTFTVALVTATDLPYFVGCGGALVPRPGDRPGATSSRRWRSSSSCSTTRAAFPSRRTITLEFGMIDEARTLEHSGPAFALLKWGSAMKQLILYVILINVFACTLG